MDLRGIFIIERSGTNVGRRASRTRPVQTSAATAPVELERAVRLAEGDVDAVYAECKAEHANRAPERSSKRASRPKQKTKGSRRLPRAPS